MASYGLKKKPTLNDLADRIENEPNTIKYPDRTATTVRNSFELSQLDGEGMRQMEQQQAQQMAEIAKENAIRNLAKNSDMNHADLSEKAKVVTKSQSVQAMLRPVSSDKTTQESRPTQQGESQTDIKQHESSSSQTHAYVQHFDISQDDQPHVEDRRAQQLEIENDALIRKQMEAQMVEQRQQRLLAEQHQHLANLTRDQELKDYELTEMLKQSQHQELQQAARLASVETQAEAFIRRQTQQHKQELADVVKDANRQITQKGKHTTVSEPQPKMKSPKVTPSAPAISPINPVPLPPPQTQSSSSSSSAPAPKAPSPKARSSSRKGTKKETDNPEAPPRKTRQGRSASPGAAQPETTGRSRSRAASDTTSTRTQLAPSVIGIQKVREELEQAKNRKKLSDADVSEYMKQYDEWKAAKGNTTVKNDKLKGLRAIYKRAVYKK